MAAKKRKIPKTVQQSIPYEYVHPYGIIESENGWFSKAYPLDDINFSIAPEDEQKDIFYDFEKLLNSFSVENPFQILIHNFKADKIATLQNVRFLPQKDNLNKYRQEMNNILLNRISEGNNSLKQNKYLIVSTQSDSVDKAIMRLNSLDRDVAKAVQNVSKTSIVEPMSTAQRLEILYNIYHKNEEHGFFNNKNSKGQPFFDFNVMAKQGLTTKDVIAPNGLKFKSNYFMIGETYARSLYMGNIPHYLTTDYLSDLANINAEMLISLNYQPVESAKALKMVRDKLTNINGEIGTRQKTAAKEGVASMLPPELEASQQATKDLMHDIMGRDQRVFSFSLTVTVFADTKEELVENVRMIDSSCKNDHNCPVRTLLFQQEDGFNTCLPLGLNRLETGKILTTESCAIYMPYTSQELHQKNGIYYGLNQTTKNLIMYNRMNDKAHNFNGLIFGESGSGKSFTAKCEMLSVLLRSDKNKVYVIDPENEYGKMAERLRGEIIELSASSKTRVNPFDMDMNFGGDDDPVALKSEYIIGMIDIIAGKEDPLSSEEKGIIDRCVKTLYREYLDHMNVVRRTNPSITQDKAATPTLNKLYHELRRQMEPEAAKVAARIEMYAQGSLNLFAHQSNVNTNARMVVYNIKNLGTGMRPLALHICLNDIWNKMFENFERGYNTWIYIDEFYLLLQTESAAKFLMQIWKRARKWRGIPTGIMQNTEDLINTDTTRNIFNNTSFMMMLSLPKLDRAALGELLQIPDSQLAFITNSPKGTGIIYTSDTLLPFDNRYPQETEVFDIMNTTT